MIEIKIAKGRFVAFNRRGGTLSEIDAMGRAQNKNMANFHKRWSLCRNFYYGLSLYQSLKPLSCIRINLFVTPSSCWATKSNVN